MIFEDINLKTLIGEFFVHNFCFSISGNLDRKIWKTKSIKNVRSCEKPRIFFYTWIELSSKNVLILKRLYFFCPSPLSEVDQNLDPPPPLASDILNEQSLSKDFWNAQRWFVISPDASKSFESLFKLSSRAWNWGVKHVEIDFFSSDLFFKSFFI